MGFFHFSLQIFFIGSEWKSIDPLRIVLLYLFCDSNRGVQITMYLVGRKKHMKINKPVGVFAYCNAQ